MPRTGTTTKKTTAPVKEASVTETPVEQAPVKKETVKVASKTYSDDDLIKCRSITNGEYIKGGKKTGAVYIFYGYGDEVDIQYNDLRTMKLSREAAIYYPRFIIEDEELLDTKEWADVKALYDSMYDAEDISQILDLPLDQFKSILSNAPAGLQKAIRSEVANGYSNGTFDSINKIRAVEEICGAEIIEFA